VGRSHGGLPQGDQREPDNRGNRQVPEPKMARTTSWRTTTNPHATVRAAAPTSPLTIDGSTGTTTANVDNFNTARKRSTGDVNIYDNQPGSGKGTTKCTGTAECGTAPTTPREEEG